MERADIATLSNALREAFLAAGSAVDEKHTVTGGAYFASGHAIGQFESRASVLRVRLWLSDKDRRSFEARPTYDGDSGWLHVVSDEDVAFLRGLIPAAYRAAASGGSGAAPSAPKSPASAPWTVTAASERRRATPPAVATTPAGPQKAVPEEKKKSASRRPSTRI